MTTNTAQTETELYAFIEAEHPFYAPIQRFQSLLRRAGFDKEIAKQMDCARWTEQSSLLRARRMSAKTWRLKWLYWSVQFRHETQAGRFAALTLIYFPEQDRVERFEFPSDPRLSAAASLFGPTQNTASELADREVLRYVPRQRLTFRATSCQRAKPLIVGKLVRLDEWQDRYARWVQVFRKASQSPQLSFTVPTPLGVDEGNGILFQQAMAGENVAELLDGHNAEDWLSTLGKIHQEIHALEINQVPEWNLAEFLQDTFFKLEWVSFFLARHAKLLGGLREFLLNHVSAVAGAPLVFCHGDFRCCQVLKDGQGWSVIDFDGAMRADPYWEIARFLTYLKKDVPLFEESKLAERTAEEGLLERASVAYLRGYEEKRGEALNPARLAWFRISCEIHFLARLLQRDRVNPAAIERCIQSIQALRAGLDNLSPNWKPV